MKENKVLGSVFYAMGVSLIVVASVFGVWLASMVVIASYYYRVGRVQLQSEGDFTALVLTYVGSFFLAPLGLIPAYFLSMNLAKWLRVKRGWQLPHPRRLFVFSILALLLILAFMILALQRP